MSVADGAPRQNIERATAFIHGAPGADLYLLPELWTTGYAHACWPEAAREAPQVAAALGALAREARAYVAGSMVSESAAQHARRNGRLVNRLWVVDPKGAVAATYDKGHLFTPMQEDRHLVPGDARAQLAVHDWTAALSLCFDLRFPEMYRLDALGGAELFLVPAEWPAARADALRVLARARAIENQAYLALCNRLGEASDGTEFGGGSMVVGPDGAIVADAEEREGVVFALLRRADLSRVRAQGSLLGQRRKGLDW